MFNTVDSEDNHGYKNGRLLVGQPPATGNRPSLTIAGDMHIHLSENNTSLIEPLTLGKNLTPYLNTFIDSVMPAVGDGNDTWLYFTVFVAGFNFNEWVFFNP